MIGTCCILGRAPRIKEIVPNFREWCRVIQHPRVFRELTGSQRGPPDLGRHIHSRVRFFHGFIYAIGNMDGWQNINFFFVFSFFFF